MHCYKSVLFDNETAWTKKNPSNMFDVTMGSFDRAEVCELIGLFLLDNLSHKYGKNNVETKKRSGQKKRRKDITRDFKKQGLNISMSANLKNLQLPRRHSKPNGRNLLSIQKAQQRNPLHRHQLQPSAYNNKTSTSSRRIADISSN